MREAHEHDPPIGRTPEELAELEDQVSARLGADRHLIEVVKFGLDMEAFAKTPVGGYLVKRAEDELNAAVLKLLDMSDLSSQDARVAHSDAKVAVKVLRWIDEAITAGTEAETAITARDEAETEVTG